MTGRTLTYFISDLHLGAKFPGGTHEHERLVCRFLRHIAPTAKTLFLMGDVLDYWYEYRTAVPRGYTRFFGTLSDLADQGVEIVWFIGNHDIWLFDYLRDEIGLTVIDGWVTRRIGARTFFLSHGDGVGKLPMGFRFIRSMFRNPVLQWLYSGIHPRWTVPFAHHWSRYSRGSQAPEQPSIKPLMDFARQYDEAHHDAVDYFVFGHLHVMTDEPLYPDKPLPRLIILGDWLSHFSYGVYDGQTLRLDTYTE